MDLNQRGKPTVLTIFKVPRELVAKGLALNIIVKADKLWRDGPQGRCFHRYSRPCGRGERLIPSALGEGVLQRSTRRSRVNPSRNWRAASNW